MRTERKSRSRGHPSKCSIHEILEDPTNRPNQDSSTSHQLRRRQRDQGILCSRLHASSSSICLLHTPWSALKLQDGVWTTTAFGTPKSPIFHWLSVTRRRMRHAFAGTNHGRRPRPSSRLVRSQSRTIVKILSRLSINFSMTIEFV